MPADRVDPTQRFSSRVENYVKYRPGYPQGVLGLLEDKCGMTAAAIVADVGSGTGILTELLLQQGNQVFAVEPNPEMRAAAELRLSGQLNFASVAGTSEATTLPDQSVEVITAAQAFHWFDREKARREFLRILKTDGWVALIWNDRHTESTPFLRAYEQLLRTHATDYAEVDHKQMDAKVIGAFLGVGRFGQASFPNRQLFDFEGLRGRLESSSYAPEAGHPKHAPMLKDLHTLFDAHQNGGQVAFEYDTVVYFGQLQP